MLEWFEQRAYNQGFMKIIGSNSTCVRSYKFDISTFMAQIAFHKNVVIQSGYKNIGYRSSWPRFRLKISSVQSSHRLTMPK